MQDEVLIFGLLYRLYVFSQIWSSPEKNERNTFFHFGKDEKKTILIKFPEEQNLCLTRRKRFHVKHACHTRENII